MSITEKENRQKCWDYRDEFWACLDKGKSKEECLDFRVNFEKFCPAQWVKHFDRKREYLKFRERMEKEGFVPEFPKKKEEQQV